MMLANVPLNSKWSRIIETIHLNLKNIYYLKIWCLFCQILKAPNIIEGHRFPANKLFDDKWSTINRTWYSPWSSWDQTIEKWYWHWKPDLDKSGRFMWPKLFLIVLKTDFNAMLLFLKFVSFLKSPLFLVINFPLGQFVRQYIDIRFPRKIVHILLRLSKVINAIGKKWNRSLVNVGDTIGRQATNCII